MQIISEIPDNSIALSSPARKSIQLIRDFKIYDCPINKDVNTWRHRECKYFAPRNVKGSMTRLFKIEKVLIMDTSDFDNEVNYSSLTDAEKSRLFNYQTQLVNTLTGDHRFYLLEEVQSLKFTTRESDKVYPKVDTNNTFTCYFDKNELIKAQEFPPMLAPDQYNDLDFYT